MPSTPQPLLATTRSGRAARHLYVINSSAADDELWIDTSGGVGDLGDIATSADAMYNAEGARFDGMLRTDRTGPALGDAPDRSLFDLSAYAGEEITLILTISDVGDHIYDSAVAIDGIYIY